MLTSYYNLVAIYHLYQKGGHIFDLTVYDGDGVTSGDSLHRESSLLLFEPYVVVSQMVVFSGKSDA